MAFPTDSRPGARRRSVPRGGGSARPGPLRRLAALLCVVSLPTLLFSGCLVSTVNHMWATRNQFLAFDGNFRYERSTADAGPALLFLRPKLNREDITALINGRHPSVVRKHQEGETWVFRYLRRPATRGKPVNLDLEFAGGLLRRIRVDKRFADHLGDARIEMLIRQFVGPASDLDLFAKRIVCRVPDRELARFDTLTMDDLRMLLGIENLIREVKLRPDEPKHIFRYRLDGTGGDKAAMSFGASCLADGRLTRISTRIGSFSLEFDLSGDR